MGGTGAEGQWQFSESELKVDLSTGRNIFEFPKGNERLGGSMGLGDSDDSQNLNLE